MLIYYGVFGLIADVALVLNVLLILGIMSLLGATLTLPGIAGIVLTIGQAVDSNVLIYERIREEMRSGRTPLSAINSGFGEAMRTIVDANLTALIAALALFQFGSGPVKGFAVTLGLGVDHQHVHGRVFQPVPGRDLVRPDPPRGPAALKVAMRRPRLVPDNTKIPFFRYRWIAFAWSLIVLFGTIVLVATSGLNLGIDFRGGVLLEVRTPGPADLALMRSQPGRARARRDLAADRRQRRAGDDPRQGARGRRGGAAAGGRADQGGARPGAGRRPDLPAGRVRRAAGEPGTADEQRLGRPGLAARRAGLSLVPVRVAVRRRCHRGAGPRRLGRRSASMRSPASNST